MLGIYTIISSLVSRFKIEERIVGAAKAMIEAEWGE